jgi:hypothetical protein
MRDTGAPAATVANSPAIVAKRNNQRSIFMNFRSIQPDLVHVILQSAAGMHNDGS